MGDLIEPSPIEAFMLQRALGATHARHEHLHTESKAHMLQRNVWIKVWIRLPASALSE